MVWMNDSLQKKLGKDISPLKAISPASPSLQQGFTSMADVTNRASNYCFTQLFMKIQSYTNKHYMKGQKLQRKQKVLSSNNTGEHCMGTDTLTPTAHLTSVNFVIVHCYYT